jgi:NADH-quinone oxidoreductase subunit C
VTAEQIHDKLKSKFGEKILDFQKDVPDPVAKVSPDALFEICQFLKNENDLSFDTLMCLSGYDLGAGKNLAVIYHLFSLKNRHKFTVRTELPRENPSVRSVEKLWRTADWHEREAYDLYGIVFENHPDLRRILCPDDWEGWPLRKDYVVQEFYHGIRVPYKEDWHKFETFSDNPDRGHFVFQFERTLTNGDHQPSDGKEK